MAKDKIRDLTMTSSVLLLVLLWHTEAAPSGMNTDLSETTQLETTTSTSQSSSCSLITVNLNTIDVDNAIYQGSLPVSIELNLLNYSADFLNQRLPGFLQPKYWISSFGETGVSLLLWKYTRWNSLHPPYIIVVLQMNVTLIDFPHGCLRSLSAENTALVIRKLILNNFRTDTQEESDGKPSQDVRVCNRIVKENEQSAMFVFHCCEKNINGDVACEEAKPNVWLNIIIKIYIPIFIVLYLYSPTLLMYFLDFGIHMDYLCEIFEPALRRFRFVCTNGPRTGIDCNQVCKANVKGEERFNGMSAQNGVYREPPNRIQLIIKQQRLIAQHEVPVGMFRLVQKLFTCRFRHIRMFKGEINEEHCCDHSCIVRHDIKLYKFFQLLSKAALLLILSIPLILLILNFHSDKAQFEEKKKTAMEMNLTVSADVELDFFIVNASVLGFLYLFLLIDLLSFGYLWKYVRSVFKKIFQQHRDNNSIRCSIKKFLQHLFECPCWYLWYVPVVCIATICLLLYSGIVLSSFYLLMSHLCRNLSSCHLKKSRVKNCFFVFIFLILYYGLAVWTFFMVCLFFSAIIGIIIYAEFTMKILTAIALLLTYGRTTFHKVWKDYMKYHNEVFEIMVKIAQRKSTDFGHNGQGILETESRQGELTIKRISSRFVPLTQITTELIATNEEAMLRIKGMFLIVDECGQLFMPVEFFYKAIEIKSCLAPGPVDSKYFNAFVSYMKIVLFLALVFIVVMAFRDAYKISLTYELLATVVASLIPLIFDLINSDDTTINQSDVDFERKLILEFEKYKEDFPIFDFVYNGMEEVPTEENDANVDLIIIKTTESQQIPNQNTEDDERRPLLQLQNCCC